MSPDRRIDSEPLSYGSPEFDTLTELAWRMAHHGRVRAALVSLLRRPASLLHLVAVLRLPAADIAVSRRDLADWRAGRLLPAMGARFSGRRAQAVLRIPEADDSYLAGRHRQALRTNIAAARRQGVHAGRSSSYEEWVDAATYVLSRRPGGADVARRLAEDGTRGRLRLFAAYGADDRPVGIAAVALVGDAALLVSLLSVPDDPAASSARYLLHATLVDDLVALGQRHLLVGSALRQSPGAQYFQHLLGYRACNLRLARHGREGQ